MFQEIGKQNVSVTLDLIGGSPLFSELQNMAQNLAIDEAISLQGKQTNVSAFYQKAPCIYIVQHQKGLGTQVEAMAAGLPVIALDAGETEILYRME